MSYIRDPEPPIEPPESDDSDVAAVCSRCGEPIFYDESCGELGNKYKCYDCLEKEWDELTAAEQFARMDYHPVRFARPEGRRRRWL